MVTITISVVAALPSSLVRSLIFSTVLLRASSPGVISSRWVGPWCHCELHDIFPWKLTSQVILGREVLAGGGTQGPCEHDDFTQSEALILLLAFKAELALKLYHIKIATICKLHNGTSPPNLGQITSDLSIDHLLPKE